MKYDKVVIFLHKLEPLNPVNISISGSDKKACIMKVPTFEHIDISGLLEPYGYYVRLYVKCNAESGLAFSNEPTKGIYGPWVAGCPEFVLRVKKRFEDIDKIRFTVDEMVEENNKEEGTMRRTKRGNITELRNHLDRMKPLEVVSIFSNSHNRDEFYMKVPHENLTGLVSDLNMQIGCALIFGYIDITKEGSVSFYWCDENSLIYGPWAKTNTLDEMKRVKLFLKKKLDVTFCFNEIELP